MESINERILFLRNTLNLTRKAFGEKIGVSDSVIKNIEYNVTEPKPLLIQQICKVYNVDPDWLETGEGEPFLQKDSVTDLFEFTKNLFLDRNLSWVRCLCEYVSQLSPEELDAAMRHIDALGKMYSAQRDKEKEQD